MCYLVGAQCRAPFFWSVYMSVDLAKRVVALQRTRASYGAMRQKDLITDAELAFIFIIIVKFYLFNY